MSEEDKLIAALKEALSELVSIVEIHQRATNNNFAWAEVSCAKEVLAQE